MEGRLGRHTKENQKSKNKNKNKNKNTQKIKQKCWAKITNFGQKSPKIINKTCNTIHIKTQILGHSRLHVAVEPPLRAAEGALSVFELRLQKLKLVIGFGAPRVLGVDGEAEERQPWRADCVF